MTLREDLCSFFGGTYPVYSDFFLYFVFIPAVESVIHPKPLNNWDQRSRFLGNCCVALAYN